MTPLHKDGSVSDPNNFRPIFVLPVVMKIFERAVHSQIYKHLSTNKLLLAHVGILDHALHWFDNYLTGRTQTVCINGTSSEPMDLNFGVPQGSVLGHLLFLTFIKNLPNCVKQSKVVLYADDTARFFANKDVMTIECVLQEELNSLNNWFHENGLIVNCSETNV